MRSKILLKDQGLNLVRSDSTKITLTGKGGVGKTTLSALLVQAYANMDKQVLVVNVHHSITNPLLIWLSAA